MKRRVPISGPLLPSEASTILTIAAVIFGLGGAQTLLVLAFVLLRSVVGAPPFVLTFTSVLGLVLTGGIALAYCFIALCLYQARRRGAYLAMGALAVDWLSLLSGLVSPSAFAVLLPVAAFVGIAFTWPHLSEAGREVDEPVCITPHPR